MYLIKNDDQKFKTLRRIHDFEAKISEIRKAKGEKAGELFVQAYGSHMEELRQQVREYEELKERGLPPASFDNPMKLGQYLIRARIAAGVTQEDLGQKLRVTQPMVHKYEVSEYAGCGLDLLLRVAEALGVSFAVAAASTSAGRVPSRRTIRRSAPSRRGLNR